MGRTNATRVARLGDYAEVLPGFSVRGRIAHEVDGTHQLVLTRHLREGAPYRYDAADELRIRPGRAAAAYELRSGDVLFMSRGTRNRAWMLERIPERTVAPVSFYVIRPRDQLDSAYLAWFLNQSPAQAAIDGIRTGAGTPLVQRAAFEELDVTLPPLVVQREVAVLGTLLAREQDLRERITDATARLHAALGRATIERLRPGGRDGGTER